MSKLKLEKFNIMPPAFEWFEFKNERERIKLYSQKYKNCTVIDAFNDVYGLGIQENARHDDNVYEVEPGMYIKLRILDVNKKGVVFDSGNVKEQIVCNMNLYQYDRFKQFIPKEPITVKVISKTNNKIVVDPIAYWLDSFIAEHSENLENQYNITMPKPVLVQNLHLTRGGYIGNIRVPKVSEFLGKDMFVEAFIPGSQIVLNIENDFEKWEGQSVTAFVMSYINKPNSVNKTFICSCKEWFKFQGNLNMISMFKDYCEENDNWKTIQATTYEGITTGICNSTNKCGVFVEIPSLNITGMVPVERTEINKYHKGERVDIRIKDFDELKKYNSETGQLVHVDPYVIKDGILQRSNLKIVLEMI